jgi:tetratricopeptide (TPR) repeat protein
MMIPRAFSSTGVFALALGLLSGGCRTTTVEQGTDYKIDEGESTSILDVQLKRLAKDAEKYPKRSDLRYQIAAVQYQKANYRESAKELETAITLSPDEVKYHYHLGRVYLYMQELSLAEKHFRQAATLSPQDRYTGPHAALGYVLAQEKKLDEALIEFKRCAQLEPENPIYYYFLGAIYDMKRDAKETLHNFQEYLLLGGQAYRQKAIFILQKLGVKVEDLPAPKKSTPDEELFGSSLDRGPAAPGEPAFERAPPEESAPKGTAPEPQAK